MNDTPGIGISGRNWLTIILLGAASWCILAALVGLAILAVI